MTISLKCGSGTASTLATLRPCAVVFVLFRYVAHTHVHRFASSCTDVGGNCCCCSSLTGAAAVDGDVVDDCCCCCCCCCCCGIAVEEEDDDMFRFLIHLMKSKKN